MKVYKNAIIATGIITLISFLASFIFNFYTQVNSFWCNALLGIFGSSSLTSDIVLQGARRLRAFPMQQRRYYTLLISIKYLGV